jgi:hypothetical protein
MVSSQWFCVQPEQLLLRRTKSTLHSWGSITWCENRCAVCDRCALSSRNSVLSRHYKLWAVCQVNVHSVLPRLVGRREDLVNFPQDNLTAHTASHSVYEMVKCVLKSDTYTHTVDELKDSTGAEISHITRKEFRRVSGTFFESANSVCRQRATTSWFHCKISTFCVYFASGKSAGIFRRAVHRYTANRPLQWRKPDSTLKGSPI